MAKRKIGVMVESFRLGFGEGLRKAAEIGADGVQIYVSQGQMTPDKLSTADRQTLRRRIAELGLEISALCADYFKGFLNPEVNVQLVRDTKACVDLAMDLGTGVITTHIGTLPQDESDPGWQAALAALGELGAYGQERGVLLASETGPESGAHLRRFLDCVPGGVVGANYDPANLVMGGFDQIGGVRDLAGYIFHTHAKDAVREPRREVPLGDGEVDFPRWVAALDEVGYDGFLTVERETGEDPVSDITKAVSFLRTL